MREGKNVYLNRINWYRSSKRLGTSLS